ncbi:MAG: PEP/pyruvate-binding domain-containing protein [Thermodesulfobacteriota bacterium]
MESYLGVDSHFKVYHDLMQDKVANILLVSSPYDAFIMEEDGSLAHRIIHEFQGLNLSHPPRLRWAASAREALHILQLQRFDLVVTMPQVGEMDCFSLAREVKKIDPATAVILLAHSLASTGLDPESLPCDEVIDRFFIWSINPAFFLAIIKNIEDHRNVAADTRRAQVRVMIVVEDSPLFASHFLPILYKEVVAQTLRVLDEGLNDEHRLLKKRARPKILLATSYEQAWQLYGEYREYVFCVIADGRFPQGCRLDPLAGQKLLSLIRADNPSLPLLMLSSEKEREAVVEKIPALFFTKDDPALEARIHSFCLDHLGFGDFIFRYPDGTTAGGAATFAALEKELLKLPEASLLFHGRQDDFATWLMARSEVELAKELFARPLASFADPAELRSFLVQRIHNLRKQQQLGVVVQCQGREYDPEIMDFVKVGTGAMGGKARGLAFIANVLPRCRDLPQGLQVRFPKSVVIGADAFSRFVAENSLARLQDEEDDEIIVQGFLHCPLPAWLLSDLRAILRKLTGPLSVRSSSLMEDGHSRPYAGIYKTCMLANQAGGQGAAGAWPGLERRLADLGRAVKLVWASTWSAGAKAYNRSLANNQQADQMAVIIQQLVGRQSGDFFYPAMSGVALSHNYYPIAPMTAGDGVVHLALGLGKTVVDGEKSLRFSPKYPQTLPQFSTVDDILANCQRHFYGLDMGEEGESRLVRRQLSEAEEDEVVVRLASTYIAAEHRIRDGHHKGMAVLTFAPVLKYGLIPLPQALVALLAMAREAMGCPVEIEFAVDLANDPRGESVLYILQLRPLVTGVPGQGVDISAEEEAAAFCSSSQALGQGVFQGISDILYVDPDSFEPGSSRAVAAKISETNARLTRQGRPYLLIGPGRWGSADPWLGIPVQWQDISGVAAFIELQSSQWPVDPSQGSHFFQNITAMGIPYVTVKEGRDHLDLAWLAAREVVARPQSGLLKHLRLAEGLVIKVDPYNSRCVMVGP